jgi:chromosome segregation protein
VFRFLELELHGWDFWQPLRIPLNASVVVLSGPNGAGKTTMLDAIRQVLHAPRLSQNRRTSHYMRRPNEPALIRAVVSNRADQRGRRPFERQQVLADEATLACALVPNGGSPEKRFLVLPGRVSPRDLQQRLLESRDWFSPEQYRRILENAGVSRSLMHILALEQGRADELSRQKPRELFGWIMEARGSQQVLDRYSGARRQYEDSMREVDRQNAQVLRSQADLAELDRKVRRLEEYLDKKARLRAAEEIKTAAWFQVYILELRDIERKLPELRTKSANLTTTTDRLRREVETQNTLLSSLRVDRDARAESARQALANCDAAITAYTRLLTDVERRREYAAELALLPEENIERLETELEQARREQFRAEHLRRDKASELDRTNKLIADLESGIRHYPNEVQTTLDALSSEGIKATLLAERVEVTNPHWSNAIESALGNLRYAISVHSGDELRATAIARSYAFLGPIVVNEKLRTHSATAGPLQFTNSVPEWLVQFARELNLIEGIELPPDRISILSDGTRRDQSGIWVSQVADHFLGGVAIRHQLELARQDQGRKTAELATIHETMQQASAYVSELEARLAQQRRRNQLSLEVSRLPALENELVQAEASTETRKRERDAASDALTAAERAVLDAGMLLQQKDKELTDRINELNGTRSAVTEMEQRKSQLEPGIENLRPGIDPKLKIQAEAGELPSPTIADRDVERAQDSLNSIEKEGGIPEETVRQERLVLQRNLDDLIRHVHDRQHEADAARLELDQCRGDYLNVIRSTLHDYSKRARSLAELAGAKLEVELPDLRNDDKSLDEAGIVVRIGFDGKPPTELGDTGHSGGQQVIAGLVLLMSMAETEGDSFFIVDEPFAHLSLDRVDDVGRFLRRSGAQFLITVPTTLDRGQLDPASLLIVLSKKPADASYAPSPVIARA